jgi:predicted phage tail protein
MALNSTSVIRVVDLLCEGPIAGLVGCDEGIFLEETAIRTGAERNFAPEDVSYDFKPGGRTQSQLEQGKDGTSTVNDVNVEIGKNYSETLSDENKVIARDYGAGQVTRQITDTDVESFELLFSIPRMFSTAQEGLAKGQLFNGSIQIAIDVQAQGAAFNTVYDRTITGIAVSD